MNNGFRAIDNEGEAPRRRFSVLRRDTGERIIRVRSPTISPCAGRMRRLLDAKTSRWGWPRRGDGAKRGSGFRVRSRYGLLDLRRPNVDGVAAC